MSAWKDTPIASCPLNPDEARRVIDAIASLRKAVGSPGDFGYESKLGILLARLYDLKVEIERSQV